MDGAAGAGAATPQPAMGGGLRPAGPGAGRRAGGGIDGRRRRAAALPARAKPGHAPQPSRYRGERRAGGRHRRERRLDRWVLPIMDAFFHQERIVGAIGSPIDYTLISRRSCLCIGARYLARGIDRYGNVANFVETEQV